MKNDLQMSSLEAMLRMTYGEIVVTTGIIDSILREESKKRYKNPDYILWLSYRDTEFFLNQKYLENIFIEMNNKLFTSDFSLSKDICLGRFRSFVYLAVTKSLDKGFYGIQNIGREEPGIVENVKDFKPEKIGSIYPIYFRNICQGVLKHMSYEEALKVLNEEMTREIQNA